MKSHCSIVNWQLNAIRLKQMSPGVFLKIIEPRAVFDTCVTKHTRRAESRDSLKVKMNIIVIRENVG